MIVAVVTIVVVEVAVSVSVVTAVLVAFHQGQHKSRFLWGLSRPTVPTVLVIMFVAVVVMNVAVATVVVLVTAVAVLDCVAVTVAVFVTDEAVAVTVVTGCGNLLVQKLCATASPDTSDATRPIIPLHCAAETKTGTMELLRMPPSSSELAETMLAQYFLGVSLEDRNKEQASSFFIRPSIITCQLSLEALSARLKK